MYILLFNAAFWFIYHNQFAFFEQFKIEKDVPWPWDTDPEGYRKDATQAFKKVLINESFVNMIFSCILMWSYDY